ncbi:MAG TPA: hypothetical protein VFU22_00655 [Roseiflexaceae bacterium]|nr:hypothetical protein [Roseiflexaceae bacterium]
MPRPDIQYHCESCGQIGPRSDLRRDSWGDAYCPACRSPKIERYHTRSETFYAWFFTFRVF